jgi:hypothetical protein
VLFAFVRLVRPRRVVEVGAGFSTLVTASAVALNARDGDDCEFVAIDPYPRDFLHGPIDGLNRLERRRAEDIAAGEITTLERNDILFIDSTHVAKVGSDVVHLALELLPRLAPGVLVHIHDIYLPWSYPRGFVEERGYYWNEQYVVQALLSGSRDFEIMLSTHWLGREHGTLVRELLPDAVPEEGGSLWLRRSAS